jgi:hypothetical protein
MPPPEARGTLTHVPGNRGGRLESGCVLVLGAPWFPQWRCLPRPRCDWEPAGQTNTSHIAHVALRACSAGVSPSARSGACCATLGGAQAGAGAPRHPPRGEGEGWPQKACAPSAQKSRWRARWQPGLAVPGGLGSGSCKSKKQCQP